MTAHTGKKHCLDLILKTVLVKLRTQKTSFKLNETKGEGREMNLCFIANNFAWIDLKEVREVRLSTHLLREHMRSSIWSLILQAWWIMAL